MNISVCIATYNGAAHVGAQLRSILSQLGTADEVIVTDDKSTDGTVAIIKNLKDDRVTVHQQNANLGPTRTFEASLRAAKNELILLSDQDDVWYPEKVSVVRSVFENNAVDVVVHDAVVVRNGERACESLFRLRGSRKGVMRNLWSNTYMGCCMAFRRKLLKDALPIPRWRSVYHDAWIGMLAEMCGRRIVFLDIPLIEYRRHETNVSVLARRRMLRVLLERGVFIACLFCRGLSLLRGRGRSVTVRKTTS